MWLEASSKRRSKQGGFVSTVLLAAIAVGGLTPSTWIVLDEDFVEDNKDRAIYTTDFSVFFAKTSPNTISNDGDLHVAGVSKGTGFTFVAEIMNARLKIAEINNILRDGRALRPETVTMEGVLRIWTEHSGGGVFEQGAFERMYNTNPDHPIEIHPVTKLNSLDLIDTLVPIRDGTREFDYKDATQAFNKYDGAEISVSYSDKRDQITIEMRQIGFNYVRFEVDPDMSTLQDVPGGKFVLADCIDPANGDVVAQDVLLVFIDGSAPMAALNGTGTFEVVGMPRLSLRKVWDDKHDRVLDRVPYEMVIVAVF